MFLVYFMNLPFLLVKCCCLFWPARDSRWKEPLSDAGIFTFACSLLCTVHFPHCEINKGLILLLKLKKKVFCVNKYIMTHANVTLPERQNHIYFEIYFLAKYLSLLWNSTALMGPVSPEIDRIHLLLLSFLHLSYDKMRFEDPNHLDPFVTTQSCNVNHTVTHSFETQPMT